MRETMTEQFVTKNISDGEPNPTNYVTKNIDMFPKEGTSSMSLQEKLAKALSKNSKEDAWYLPSSLPLSDDKSRDAFECLVGTCANVYASILYSPTQFSRCSCSALSGVCDWYPDTRLCTFVGTSMQHTCGADETGKTNVDWEQALAFAVDPTQSSINYCLPFRK